jgi:hypothetical protein
MKTIPLGAGPGGRASLMRGGADWTMGAGSAGAFSGDGTAP